MVTQGRGCYHNQCKYTGNPNQVRATTRALTRFTYNKVGANYGLQQESSGWRLVERVLIQTHQTKGSGGNNGYTPYRAGAVTQSPFVQSAGRRADGMTAIIILIHSQ